MKITAICNTYRRPELLEEALHSFLMQDYAGEKELIILNDEPEQEIVYKHSQVRVVNMPSRAPDLATKHNFAVSIATGDIITPWDDDDLFLSNRLTTIAKGQKSGGWYADHLFTDTEAGELNLTVGKIHCNHAYSHSAFIRIGAYHERSDLSFDFVLMNLMRSAMPNISDKALPSYIYRKNSTATKNYSDLCAKDPFTTWERCDEANAEFTRGRIELNPHWSRNWQALADEALQRNPVPVLLHELDEAYKPQTINGKHLKKT